MSKTNKTTYKKIITMLILVLALPSTMSIKFLEAQYGDVKIPILCYHSVSENIPKEGSYLYITPEKLEHQMNLLIDNGYTPISYYDLIDFVENEKDLPARPVIITFDDGYYDNYKYAYPIFQKLDIKATIFVITDNMGHKTQYARTDKYQGMLSWEECLEMEESGLIDIESHTVTHRDMTKLSKSEYIDELSKSKEKIDKELNKNTIAFAYPYGYGNNLIAKEAENLGYKAVNYVYPSYINYITKGNLLRLTRVEANDDITDEEFLSSLLLEK